MLRGPALHLNPNESIEVTNASMTSLRNTLNTMAL
jgi:hypothetical protein